MTMRLTTSERQLLGIIKELHAEGIEVRHRTIMDRYQYKSSWLTALLRSLRDKGAITSYSRFYYVPAPKNKKQPALKGKTK